MGKVFTKKELQKGKTPRPGAHEKVIEILHKTMKDRHEFVFASLFGSTALGRATVRSSIQIVVVVRDDLEGEGIKKLFELTYAMFKKYYVRLQISLFTQSEWEKGCTSFGYNHIEQIRMCVENKKQLCGESDFLKGILLPTERENEAFFYIAETITLLRKQTMSYRNMSNEEECTMLQQALESPVRAVRLYLAKRKTLGDAWEKKKLAASLKKEKVHVGELFEACIRNSERYGELVVSCVNGDITPGQYAAMLKKEQQKAVTSTLCLLRTLAWRLLMTGQEIKDE